MKAIVVGYDGSEVGERALARAADVAQAFSARLIVVSVERFALVSARVPALEPAGPMLVPPAGAGPVPTGAGVRLPDFQPEGPPEPEEIARRRLEQARMALTRRRVEAEYVVEVGEPVTRLLEVAHERDADLIVVGS